MKKKGKNERISVTLPMAMLKDFKCKSEITGLSISRLIYLRLRSRKSLMVVNADVLEEIRQLRQHLGELSTTGMIFSFGSVNFFV